MYHEGERKAQEITGEVVIGERNGRIISDKIMPGAVNFIQNQAFFIASSQNLKGDIFTSIIAGNAGFVKILEQDQIEVSSGMITSNPHDLFWQNINIHPKIGLLFIDLATRKRFRINGTVISIEDKIRIKVEQAYPNCPKYIQKRYMDNYERAVYSSHTMKGDRLDDQIEAIIRSADTLFVGSGDQEGNLDASHRGGERGFVKIADEQTLMIPDYSGNSMFNTLGNFIVNANAGLLFIDYTNGLSLQLMGTAEVIWHNEIEENWSGGTGRYWCFKLRNWILIENMKGSEWTFVEYSPFNPKS